MFTSYRIASAVPELIPGNIQYNITQIIDLCNKAAGHGAGVILFPELCITGASCGDLFGSSHLISGVQKAIQEVKKFTSSCECAVVAGFPLFYCGRVYDCAAVFHNGKCLCIYGIQPAVRSMLCGNWCYPQRNELSEMDSGYYRLSVRFRMDCGLPDLPDWYHDGFLISHP